MEADRKGVRQLLSDVTTDPTRIVIASFHENKGAYSGGVCDRAFLIKYRLKTVFSRCKERRAVYDAVINGKLPPKAVAHSRNALVRAAQKHLPDAGPNMERHAVYSQDSIIMLYAAETKRDARRSLLARSLGHRIEKNLEMLVIEQPIAIAARQDNF